MEQDAHEGKSFFLLICVPVHKFNEGRMEIYFDVAALSVFVTLGSLLRRQLLNNH